MNKNEMFGSALWVGPKDGERRIHILRTHITLNRVKKANLRVLGLGTFHCYINGKRVGDDLFLPLNSEFEPRDNFPKKEILTAHRIYVPEYDVTDMLKDGENLLVIHFGAGWYTYDRECKFGDAKAIWRLFGESADGEFDLGSSTLDLIGGSFVCGYTDNVRGYSMSALEDHDYRSFANALDPDYDDSGWENTIEARELQTEYCFCDCPADKICKTLIPTRTYQSESVQVFDAGRNTTGYPVLRLKAKSGEKIKVSFSEELLPSGRIDPKYNHNQYFTAISDGLERSVHPYFMWCGFRYFELEGEAEVERVEILHTGVGVSADFHTDNETLNWIYDTFLATQLTNMHTGIPSDCPHMERRGYTGDGQLICHAAMNILDAESFYRKWVQDIADSQDSISGHVQYTAPYTHSGGGPGGWGSAIVEVSYQIYRHYGGTQVLDKYYPAMLRYFDYLEAHSENGLVTSDKEGEWCLGDWCTPKSVTLPAPFVNNYFYIKALMRASTIATLIGKEDDIPEFKKRTKERKRALMSAYYNKWDGNFLGGVQAANAFMLDIGLGDERTYPELVKLYKKVGCFDTGIFGTEILTRILFEHGDAELATELLCSEKVHSFAEMKRRGATTLWEYWPESLEDRSHNHPMFGAVTAHLFDYLGGIREAEGSLTYEKIRIEPLIVSGIGKLYCKRMTPRGEVTVKYEKLGGELKIHVTVPERSELSVLGEHYELNEGENSFSVALKN